MTTTENLPVLSIEAQAHAGELGTLPDIDVGSVTLVIAPSSLIANTLRNVFRSLQN